MCLIPNRLMSAALPLLALTLAITSPARGEGDSTSQTINAPAHRGGLYVKIQLPKQSKMSKLKPGDSIEGTLARDVYSADHKVFSSGNHVRLSVDHLERRRRVPNDHWPWIVKAFTPRHENYPVFNQATVIDSASESALSVSVISIARTREIHSRARVKQLSPATPNAQKTSSTAGPTMILEAFPTNDSHLAAPDASPAVDLQKLALLPPGTRCRIVLMDSVSASKSKPGDAISARLLEPVLLDSQVVLPAGSTFEGKVLKRMPPRMLSRSGSLNLAFTSIVLPQGNRLQISASLSGAVINQGSHTRLDREGILHGERPGRAWMAINLGMTAGISKEVDDGMQLLIEALVSSATDASTAGTSRIVSSCVSGIYMATRHGRDVVLPRFSEMEITIDRGVSMSPNPTVASASTPAAK